MVKKIEHLARWSLGHLYNFLPFFPIFSLALFPVLLLYSFQEVFFPLWVVKDLVWLVQSPILFFSYNYYAWLNQ